MDRRAFLRRAAIASSGIVAADQLELLDRLGWVRRFFNSILLPSSPHRGPFTVTHAQWNELLQESYVSYVHAGIVQALKPATPFKSRIDHERKLLAGSRYIEAPAPLVWSLEQKPDTFEAENAYVRDHFGPNLVRGVDWDITRTTFPQWNE